MTTRNPRMVGYQSVLWRASAARTAFISRLLQRPLVRHDLLDLSFREHGAEVRHTTGGDAADAVLLVGGHADRDPAEQVALPGGRRELRVDVAVGEVRAERTPTHLPGRRV